MKMTPYVLGACLLTMFVACGSYDDDDNGSDASQPEQQQDQFRVVLTPVNPEIAGDATGTGEININADELRALINVDTAPNAEHDQNIHVGTRCPAATDDMNGDGFIDYVEASAAAGGILIPLDSDLRSQDAGDQNMSGVNYDYNESTSYAAMLADLHLPDLNTSDDVVKLNPDDDLVFEGKVIQVHGIPATTVLPATVAGNDDETPQESLPILCGVITRATGGTTGTTTGETGTTTGETGTTTGETGTTTGETGTTTGETGTTTGTTTGDTGATTGGTTGM